MADYSGESQPYYSQHMYDPNDYGNDNDQFHAAEFPVNPGFQSFEYSQQQGNYTSSTVDKPNDYAPYTQPQHQPYTGNIFTPEMAPVCASELEEEDYGNEPPLLEELGINFDHIRQKTVAVLHPLQKPDVDIMQDTDFAGPLIFGFAFASTLLLAGKVIVGYVYGIGVIGCLAMYALLNVMSMQGVSVGIVISVLGYCLLPMVFLSVFAVVFSLQGITGSILTSLAVGWCATCASKFFVSTLGMDSQQLLVAYPCALVYGVFALLTVF